MLALNYSHTEVRHLHSKFVKYPVPSITATVGESQISPSAEIMNLGATMDSSYDNEVIILTKFHAVSHGWCSQHWLYPQVPWQKVHKHPHTCICHITSGQFSTHYLVTFPKRTHPGFGEFRTFQHAITARTIRTFSPSLITVCIHTTVSQLTYCESSRPQIVLKTYKALHGLAPMYISELVYWGINNVEPFVRKVTFFFRGHFC